MFSKDKEEKCVKYSKSKYKEIMIVKEADEVIKDFFDSLLSRYQVPSKNKWKATVFSLIVFIYCITNVTKYVWTDLFHDSCFLTLDIP